MYKFIPVEIFVIVVAFTFTTTRARDISKHTGYQQEIVDTTSIVDGEHSENGPKPYNDNQEDISRFREQFDWKAARSKTMSTLKRSGKSVLNAAKQVGSFAARTLKKFGPILAQGANSIHNRLFGKDPLEILQSSLHPHVEQNNPYDPNISEECKNNCNGHGTCVEDNSKTVNSSDFRQPRYCKCTEPWVGGACERKRDDLYSYFESRGAYAFPPCCSVCSSQLNVPQDASSIPVSYNPVTIRGCDPYLSESSPGIVHVDDLGVPRIRLPCRHPIVVMTNGQQFVSSPSSASTFLEQQETYSIGGVLNDISKSLTSAPPISTGMSLNSDGCCVVCEAEQSSHNLLYTEDSDENCCNMCPRPLISTQALESNPSLSTEGATQFPSNEALSSIGTSVSRSKMCCNVCASQFWLENGPASPFDQFHIKDDVPT